MDSSVVSSATTLFQNGLYTEALSAYTAALANPVSEPLDVRISLLFNRSACHLKLKQFAKVVEDCDTILSESTLNGKALRRKIKALWSLRRFKEAENQIKQWIKADPDNEQAKKELSRLDIIVRALQDQEGEEDTLDETIASTEERLPPEGKEDDVSGTGSSPNNIGMVAAPVASNIVMSVDCKTSDGSDSRPTAADHYTLHQSAIYCSHCDTTFSSQQELKYHTCSNNQEAPQGNHDGTNSWQFRPPPRGLTSIEYTKCPRFFGEGMCRFGDNCSQAHSEAELVEWRTRFEQHKEHLQLAHKTDFSSNQFASQLLEKLLTASNSEQVMVTALDGLNVHLGCNASVTMTSKHCSHTWLFTLTSKMSMHRMALLEDGMRSQFQVVAVTVGPKRSQKGQKIDDNGQGWTNPNFEENTSTNDQVFRVKILFRTEIYGTFRQSVVFDFGSEPVLVQELCVDSSPVVDLDQLNQDLVISDTARWDAGTRTIVHFEPRVDKTDEVDEELLRRFPSPKAATFKASETLLEPEHTASNYVTRMHQLLCIEEMARHASIAKFNVKSALQIVDRFLLMPSMLSNARFAQNGELFARLKLVSDISEDTLQGRLILQNVHTVLLAPSDKTKQQDCEFKVYEALVEEKGKNFIFMRLSATCVKDLQLKPDTNFPAEVQFQLNRLPLCEMHLAIDRLQCLPLLFPPPDFPHDAPWSRTVPGHLDDRLNMRQKEAVVAMMTPTPVNVPPILIVGPYGTGKTFTLAQAAIEIVKAENTRVLICTHSNSAADLYIKDYLHPYVDAGHKEATPLRIFYRHRWVQTVHPTVIQYALLGANEQGRFFRRPTKEDIEKHRIIVATLSTSRDLYNLQLGPGYFTHILLDEAAQAMEVETIMPLALAHASTRVILAGDHMQLSPEVHSEFTRDRNLHLSFLERLYDAYNQQHPCRILLCENYRSHEAIVDFTSELFYDSRLVASGNQPRHHTFFPLTFFTARGEDIQHQNSTTFYNNSEVYEVVERVAELRKVWPESWGTLEDQNIGVVAPYADQVVHIRSEMRKRKMFRVSVERVLNVQGKQFRAIFLSTVRTRHTCSPDSSHEDFMDYGFLSNVKLLNTAITRGQSLVAVVGDPVALCSVGKCRKLWERFIEICSQHNSLYGMTWADLRTQLDDVELKKTYILNPLAPEFVPTKRRICPPSPSISSLSLEPLLMLEPSPPQQPPPPAPPPSQTAPSWLATPRLKAQLPPGATAQTSQMPVPNMLFPRMPYGMAPPQQGAALHRGPIQFLKSEMSPKSPSSGEAVKLASPHLLSPAGVSTSTSGGSGDPHSVHGDRVLHGIPLLSDPNYPVHQWPAMIPPHLCKPPFPPAPLLPSGTRPVVPLPVPQPLMMPPARGMLPRWAAPNAYMGAPFPGSPLPGMAPGAFMPDVGHGHVNPTGLSSPGGRVKTTTPASQVQFLPTACNVQGATSHPRMTSDPMQHHVSLHSIAEKVAQMNNITGSMSPTFRNNDNLQAARKLGHMAEGHRSPLFWNSMHTNGFENQSPGGARRHHESNGGAPSSNSKLHMHNDPLRVETSAPVDVPYYMMNEKDYYRNMYSQPHQRAAAAAAANVQWNARDNNLLCVQRPAQMPPGDWQQMQHPGQQRPPDERNIEDDGLNDLIQPSIVDHMVRFIERSLDDTPAPENELANIHIGHGNVALPGETTPPGDKVPLYLRGSGKGAQQSYASAVRSRPVTLNQSLPELDVDDVDLSTSERGEPNPLDLLKNLNIKASPGTQAFYQYFS